uniref:hypothetical protein n=1 Tax=Candidatus Limisoma sp. TaxID=3076476 RepID=UPI0040273908
MTINIAIESCRFFCGMENAKACASAALRDGEKSLKCIGFLDGKGAVLLSY